MMIKIRLGWLLCCVIAEIDLSLKIFDLMAEIWVTIPKSQGWMFFWLDNDDQPNARSPIKPTSIAWVFCRNTYYNRPFAEIWPAIPRCQKRMLFSWTMIFKITNEACDGHYVSELQTNIWLFGQIIASYFKISERNAIQLDNDEPNVWCHQALFVFAKLFFGDFLLFWHKYVQRTNKTRRTAICW